VLCGASDIAVAGGGAGGSTGLEQNGGEKNDKFCRHKKNGGVNTNNTPPPPKGEVALANFKGAKLAWSGVEKAEGANLPYDVNKGKSGDQMACFGREKMIRGHLRLKGHFPLGGGMKKSEKGQISAHRPVVPRKQRRQKGTAVAIWQPFQLTRTCNDKHTNPMQRAKPKGIGTELELNCNWIRTEMEPHPGTRESNATCGGCEP